MHRRFLPLILAAVFAVPGCVSVAPDTTRPPQAPSLAPAALRTAAVSAVEENAGRALDDPQPSARTGLVDTGTRPPRVHQAPHQPQRHEAPRRTEQLAPANRPHPYRPRAAAPHPMPRHQPARPAPRHRAQPHPRHRTPSTGPAGGVDMRTLCHAAADQQLNPGIVAMCHNTYG
ncbi:hypothetical protein [Streptomyces sp. NPDC001297]|uniref:hypothetical protein n=1 Tax=Streptomyces sp. NPDC001297 TaxID=3364559 RepID=UPI00367D5FCC